MSTVQHTGSKRFDSQIQMHNGNQKYDVNLAQEFQEHLKKKHRKDGVIDQEKTQKLFMERKCTYRQYHV